MLNQTSIQYYMNRQDLEIRNEGYIDKSKASYNTRLFLLNPNGCRPSDNAKTTMFVNSYKRLQIDMYCITEINTKQTTRNID